MDKQRAETLAKLKHAFSPRNIAVVGAAKHNDFRWLRRHLPFQEIRGKVFHVNINKKEWPDAASLGVETYATVTDIPEPVDYVTISVPRHIVPQILEDCIKKEVTAVHVFSAGFSESGEPEGLRLDGIVSELARKSGILLIGPNCMGLFNPILGIRQMDTQPYGESGFMGYISQSGSQSLGFTSEAYASGITISKCISMGNGMVTDSPDYLDYLADDEDTKLIGMYIEGVRNPPRFFQSLRDASRKKPVLVWKVGQTEDAARASEAHSATPYIRDELWNALMLSCNAIEVDSMDEMIEVTRALSLVPITNRYNIGLMAVSGGHSTEMANVFSKNGFKIPPLSKRSYQQLASFFDIIGGNYVNPIQGSPEHFGRILEILRQDSQLDIVAVELSFGPGREIPQDRIESIKNFKESSNRPIIVIFNTSFRRMEPSAIDAVDETFTRAGVPVFYGFEHGAKALKKVIDYYAIRALLPA